MLIDTANQQFRKHLSYYKCIIISRLWHRDETCGPILFFVDEMRREKAFGRIYNPTAMHPNIRRFAVHWICISCILQDPRLCWWPHCAPLLYVAIVRRSLAETFTLTLHLVISNVQSSDSFSRRGGELGWNRN